MPAMRSLRWALPLLPLALFVGCGDEDATPAPDPYFTNGGQLVEDAHSNVVRRFEFLGVDEPGVALGFDLDGRVSDGDDRETCGKKDFTDPEGRTGIDNQMARIWSIIEPLIGTQVQALLHGAINEGRFLLLIELVGADDMKDATGVDLNIFRGTLSPQVGTTGLLAPDQTVYFDTEFPSSTVKDVSIVDGMVEAGPVEFQLPIDILEANFIMRVFDGRLRFTINDDGTFEGIIGGVVNVRDVLDEVLATDAYEEAALVAPIFEANADLAPVDGKCTNFSMAFRFEGTTAFVVRPPE